MFRKRKPLSTLGFADLTPPYDWLKLEAEMLLAPDSMERTVALLAISEIKKHAHYVIAGGSIKSGRSTPNDPMIPDRRS